MLKTLCRGCMSLVILTVKKLLEHFTKKELQKKKKKKKNQKGLRVKGDVC